MLHTLISIWFGWVRDWGFWGVFILMALESTIVPVPSELVIPPAAYWAAQGQTSLAAVIAASTLGSYVGSAISYWTLRLIGPTLLYRFGKYFLLSPAKIKMAESVVRNYGAPGVFIARMLPVIRHLISMPAGLFKMNFALFSVVTLAGAGIWCTILALWGEKVIGSHPELLDSPEQMMHVVRKEMFGFIAAVIGFAFLYILVIKYKRATIK